MKTMVFFDSPKVKRAVDRAKRRALGQSGAIIRKTARWSMRKARRMRVSEMPAEMRESYQRRAKIAKQAGLPRPKRPFAASRAGEPPRVRLGHLKRLLFYGWDSVAKSVVVGPAKFKTGHAPRILEKSGTSYVRIGRGARTKSKRIRVAARPYMGPALRKEKDVMAYRWRNSVRSGP